MKVILIKFAPCKLGMDMLSSDKFRNYMTASYILLCQITSPNFQNLYHLMMFPHTTTFPNQLINRFWKITQLFNVLVVKKTAKISSHHGWISFEGSVWWYDGFQLLDCLDNMYLTWSQIKDKKAPHLFG